MKRFVVTWDNGHATMRRKRTHKSESGIGRKKNKEDVDSVNPSVIQPVMFSFVACTPECPKTASQQPYCSKIMVNPNAGVPCSSRVCLCGYSRLNY